VAFDNAGNLYGTTFSGGVDNVGVVFELVPKMNGGWSEQVLHSFLNDGKDGSNPFSSLILDASGNLYGVTVVGGEGNIGTAYELVPDGGGKWKETVLHSFNPNGKDGANPYTNLSFDHTGNIFGTTANGGKYSNGTVFEITP